MKKFFTLVAAAMLSAGAFAQEVGVQRVIDYDALTLGNIEAVEALGVKVTPVRGADCKYRDEVEAAGDATDLYVGYSLTQKKEGSDELDYAANKNASKLTCGVDVIYPKVAEQSSRQEEEYFGYKMEIPAGSKVNIDKLDVYLLAGNAYYWQVEITNEAGDVLYKTQDKGIKINSYNRTCYTNGVTVTAEAVAEPEWSAALLEGWNMSTTYDVADTTPLTETVNNLEGNVYVKVYYWGKWQKNLTFAHVLTTLSGETTAISNVAVSAQKVTKSLVNGKIVIANGANTYNVAGQLVK